MRLGWAASQARRLLARHPLDVLTFARRRVPRIPRVLLEARRARRTPLPREVPVTPSVEAERLLEWEPLPLPEGARAHARQWLDEGIIHLFGAPVETGWPPRWGPPGLGDFGDGASHDIAYYGDEVEDDIKRPWELQRHWLLPAAAAEVAADEDASRQLVDIMLDWATQHPPLRTIAWMEGIEVTLRLIAWTDALARLPSAAYAVDDRTGRLATVLAEHAQFLRGHLSRKWRLNNNHLLLELVGLVVAGASQCAAAARERWSSTGLRLLDLELARQVPDGRDWEPTTAYHRFVTEAVLVAAHGWRQNSSPAAQRHIAGLEARLVTMVESLVWLTDGTGHMPLVGDDDAGIVLPRAADWAVTDATQVLDLARHLDIGIPDPQGVRIWPEVGMGVLRQPPFHVHLTAGAPRGAGRQGSHRHLDMLSASVSVAGQPILIDPGTGLYFGNRAWRDHFRSARVHPGIWSPGTPWAELKDLFEVPRPPVGTLSSPRPGCLEAMVGDLIRPGPTGWAERECALVEDVLLVWDRAAGPARRWSYSIPAGAAWEREAGSVKIRLEDVHLHIDLPGHVEEVVGMPDAPIWDSPVIDGSLSEGYGTLRPGRRLEVAPADAEEQTMTTLIATRPIDHAEADRLIAAFHEAWNPGWTSRPADRGDE